MGNSLEGKVAIVTGAGRGLGRVEALALAGEGARVVVNDYGVGADGSGSSQDPAHGVVEEIKSAGGEAVAAFGDVGDWGDVEAVVKKAIDTYGDVNIVVNNAGFCRDRMIFNMTEDEFDAVVRVHLKGHFCPDRRAPPTPSHGVPQVWLRPRSTFSRDGPSHHKRKDSRVPPASGRSVSSCGG